MPQHAKKLSVEYRQTGSLVVAFNDEQVKALDVLYKRGIDNGVKVSIIDCEQLHRMEPALSQTAKAALYAPEAGIISPWDLCLAFAEVAAREGCDFLFEAGVESMNFTDGAWNISTPQGVVRARCVVNAAGLYADKIAAAAGAEPFAIRPVKGQYFLLDRSQGGLFSHAIFQCPSAAGKGVLISPTVTGNLIVGPDAQPVDSVEDTQTDSAALQFIRQTASIDTDQVNYRDNIRNFAGVRAYSDRDDFIIGPSRTVRNFINIAGMKSPGLSSSAAIAPDVAAMIADFGIPLVKKENFDGGRTKIRFCELSAQERAELVSRDPSYGRIVCRCNTVTEGEIIAALRSPLPPRTIDGVKRRTGAGMGRCQGGFCSPIVHRLISESGIPFERVCREKAGSYIVVGPTKRA